MLLEPAQRGAEVVPVAFQTREPGALCRSVQVRLRLLGKGEEILGVAPTDRLGLAAFVKLLGGVGAERFEESVTRAFVIAVFDRDEGVTDQPLDRGFGALAGRLCPVVFTPHVWGAGPLGGIQVETAGEDPEPGKDAPVRRTEQTDAPVDRGTEGAVAGERRSAVVAQEAKPIVQPGGDLPDRERGDPRGGVLDREREPVELPTDGRHDRCGALGQGEVGTPLGGALGEQLDGRRRQDGAQPGVLVRRRERRHRPDGFTRHAEGSQAGGDDAEVRAGPQERLDEVGAGRDEVLAVVEEEQHAPRPEMGDQAGDGGLVPRSRETERAEDQRGNERGLGQGSEIDEQDTLREISTHAMRELQRQPRLADPGRTGQGQEATRRKESGQRRERVPASDEAGEGKRQGGDRAGPTVGPVAERGEPLLLGPQQSLPAGMLRHAAPVLPAVDGHVGDAEQAGELDLAQTEPYSQSSDPLGNIPRWCLGHGVASLPTPINERR